RTARARAGNEPRCEPDAESLRAAPKFKRQPNANADTNRDTNTNPDTVTEPNPDADSFADSDTEPDAIPNAVADAQSDADAFRRGRLEPTWVLHEGAHIEPR
ncbi:MAG TPA: hypothetical protein VN812_08350, partial [Candidatus Acidoferrales bacterium]|nr:hypothetical protein [Candidatus Acidoferrales bacterium]